MADAKRTAWQSYALREAGAGDPVVGWYGGHPRGVRTHEWPRCGVCGAPMCHMAQILAGPWLDLGAFQRLSVFICHATGGRCEDWDPWKGANKVLLHATDDDALYDGPPTVRVYRRFPLAVQAPLDELEVMIRVKKEGFPMQDALEALRHDKLGGGAVWLTGDQTPQSPSGQGPMRLLMQLTTDLVKFDITDQGIAYVFVDPNAPQGEAVLLWQGG